MGVNSDESRVFRQEDEERIWKSLDRNGELLAKVSRQFAEHMGRVEGKLDAYDADIKKLNQKVEGLSAKVEGLARTMDGSKAVASYRKTMIALVLTIAGLLLTIARLWKDSA